jgi:hypothetical protein
LINWVDPPPGDGYADVTFKGERVYLDVFPSFLSADYAAAKE